ncbi:hypothetical protein MMC21_004761 [Puttea exsequens]|nr:hypothetical protein [Puttea exsequens]
MSGHPAVKGLADPSLLKKIDKFFELGIGEYVALAQITFRKASQANITLSVIPAQDSPPDYVEKLRCQKK